MRISQSLERVRKPEVAAFSQRQKLLRWGACVLLGGALGFLSKWVEALPHLGTMGDFLNLIGNLTSRLGLWIFCASLLAGRSRSPGAAAAQVFGFFAGMLAAYYAYTTILFGYFPTVVALRWGAMALVSPLGGVVVWYGAGKGWPAALCAGLPVGLLWAQGISFFGTGSLLLGVACLMAVALWFLLPAGWRQRLLTLPFAAAVAAFFRMVPVLSWVLGGL